MAEQIEPMAGAPSTTVGAPARPGLGRLARNEARATPGFWIRAWRRFRRDRLAMSALFVVVVVVLFALGAGLISRYVSEFTPNEDSLANKLEPVGSQVVLNEGRPSERTATFFLGSDGNGRDVLTRLAYGGRISLMVAGLAAVATLVLGSLIGSVSGFFGGVADAVLMRFVDVLLSMPGLPLLILVSSLYRPSPAELALIIAAISWAGIARLIRGEVLSLRSRDYVDAARVLGAPNSRIISRHILPNVVPLVVVWLSLVIPGLILTEASLSYLGLGVRTPTPSWGNMLQEAKGLLRQSWTLVFIPGVAIYITVLAINLVGNGIRDAIDPRLNN